MLNVEIPCDISLAEASRCRSSLLHEALQWNTSGLDVQEVSPHYHTVREAVWAMLGLLWGLARGCLTLHSSPCFTLSCLIALTLKVPKQQPSH